MTRRRLLCGLAGLLCGSTVGAVDLGLPPAAQMTVERATELDSFAAPIGVFAAGEVPVHILEGAVTRRAWRIGTGGLTPLQVVAPLRAQIEALGYDIAFECDGKMCGGFDFRFAIEVLPGPNMYVNIGAFRYLTAVLGPTEDPTDVLTVLASVTAASAYVQVIHATTEAGARPPVPAAPPTQQVEERPAEPEADLLRDGFVILGDLDFGTGTTDLGAGPFASLGRLAELMSERPELRVALVGHTDTVGALEPNIALSRARAQEVRQRLIDQYQIDPARLDAEGMGYLAPVASNRTPEGRDRNRRVEAVLLNVE